MLFGEIPPSTPIATGFPPFGVGNPEVKTFHSWGAFLDYCETAPSTIADANRLSRTHDADRWVGCADWDATVKLAREGWKSGEEKVRAVSRRLEARLLHKIVREDTNYDVEGMAFDVARYLHGEPEHWLRPEETTAIVEHGTKHVKLVVNVSASAGVSAEAITARGAATAALVELLEYGDHHVEVWAMDASTFAYNNERPKPPVHVDLVKLKAYDQPLDMGRLAFALAHPGMLRRLCFSAAESADPSIVRWVSHANSYGYPAEYTPEGTSIYLPGSKLWDKDCNWTSPESVEVWLLAQLAKQNIILRDD